MKKDVVKNDLSMNVFWVAILNLFPEYVENFSNESCDKLKINFFKEKQ